MTQLLRRALAPTGAIALTAILLVGCGGGGSGEEGTAPQFESAQGANDPNAAMDIGEDLALPANWPPTIPKPNGGKANSVGVAENGNANAFWVFTASTLTVASDYDVLLTQAGYSKVPDSDIDVEGMAGGDWIGNGYTLSVLVSDNGDGTTSLSLNATVIE